MNRRDAVQSAVLLAVAGTAWLALRPGRSDDATDGAPPEAPQTTRPAATPARPHDAGPRVTGRILDAEGDLPIGGARVVVVVTPSGGAASWFASDSSRDGTFDIPLGAEVLAADARLDLRVQTAGFRTWRGVVGDVRGEQIVRLEGLARDLVPGRIVVRAHDVEGRPISGPVAVHGFDDVLLQLHRSAMAGADGMFVLEGVPPGTWSLTIGDDTQRTDVALAEGADAHAEVRTETRFLGEPAFTGAKAAEELDEQIADVERRAKALEAAAAQDQDVETRVAIRRRMEDLSRLHRSLVREQTRTAPHREVLFRGVPLATRAWIAAPGDDGEWVVEARKGGPGSAAAGTAGTPDAPSRGEVRIPWMPLGVARIQVRLLDLPDEEFRVEIVAGTGTQIVDLPPR